MFLRFLKIAMFVFCAQLLVVAAEPLKICTDPDNLPFSNRHGQGFDNKIAELLGNELGRPVQFVWRRAGRGFVRENLNKGVCDALVGVPVQFRPVLTTMPYYSSSYVFVTRKSNQPKLESFDDPRLKNMKIGVQILDDDYAPPARALARRQLAGNIVGFDTTGAQSGNIINAVAHGKIDAAIVWGPLAVYYASRNRIPLTLSPVVPEIDPPALPFRFAMAVGVRKSDQNLKKQIESALVKKHAAIERVLRAYSVPQYEPLPAQARLK